MGAHRIAYSVLSLLLILYMSFTMNADENNGMPGSWFLEIFIIIHIGYLYKNSGLVKGKKMKLGQKISP